MTTDFRLKDTIKGYLMSLRELTGEDSRKIATRLGYENNPFLKLDTDEKYNGSTQLLAGIKTLLELEKINRKKPPKTIEERLADLESQVVELQAMIRASLNTGIEFLYCFNRRCLSIIDSNCFGRHKHTE